LAFADEPVGGSVLSHFRCTLKPSLSLFHLISTSFGAVKECKVHQLEDKLNNKLDETSTAFNEFVSNIGSSQGLFIGVLVVSATGIKQIRIFLNKVNELIYFIIDPFSDRSKSNKLLKNDQ